jgi:hypothetical protein
MKSKCATCPQCGNGFEKKKWNQKYCCRKCYKKAKNTRTDYKRAKTEARKLNKHINGQKRYYKMKEQGLCPDCGVVPESDNVFCTFCEERKNANR